MNSSTAKPEIKSLQILRAIAAMSVVYYHIIYVPTVGSFGPAFGAFGVDIFFVISGFVMALIVSQPQQTPAAFAINRISRIVPLYWVLTTVMLVLAYLRPDLLNSTTANVGNYIKSLFFIPYVKENGKLVPMLALGWTLNYEMYFYFCIWFAMSVGKKYFAQITALLITSAFIILGLWTPCKICNAFFGDPIVFEFLFGILAFKLYQTRFFANASWILLLGLSVVCYTFLAFVQFFLFDDIRVLWEGIPSFIFVIAVVHLEPHIAKLKQRWVDWAVSAGNASYATYLSHMFVVELIRKFLFQRFHLIDNLYTPIGIAFTIFCALAVGEVLYRVFDRRLSRYCKMKLTAAYKSITKKSPS